MPKIVAGQWLMRNGDKVEIFGPVTGYRWKWIGATGRTWNEDGSCISKDCPNQFDLISRVESVEDGGVKHDDGKLPLHLLPFDALEEVAHILDLGQRKYAARNWERGMEWHRLFRAATGHLWSWFLRRGNDPESGRSHLAHAACCVLMLISYELRGVGNDTRPGKE